MKAFSIWTVDRCVFLSLNFQCISAKLNSCIYDISLYTLFCVYHGCAIHVNDTHHSKLVMFCVKHGVILGFYSIFHFNRLLWIYLCTAYIVRVVRYNDAKPTKSRKKCFIVNENKYLSYNFDSLYVCQNVRYLCVWKEPKKAIVRDKGERISKSNAQQCSNWIQRTLEDNSNRVTVVTNYKVMTKKIVNSDQRNRINLVVELNNRTHQKSNSYNRQGSD